MRSLWKSFFLFFSKILTFRPKGRYFEITMNMSFSENISDNINILRKMKSLWDNFVKIVFGPYRRKYQNSGKMYFSLDLKNINFFRKLTLFWDHFEYVVFCSYHRKYRHFEKKHIILRSLLEIVFFTFESINISRKTTLF